MNALNKQSGGSHYKNKAIQPVEFSMANRLDSCAHSIVKYVPRHSEKGGLLDLEKAYHFVELREVLATDAHRVDDWVVTMQDYCTANKLPAEETAALLELANWLESGSPVHLHRLKIVLQDLIALRYPTNN